MSFLNLSVAESITSDKLPPSIDVVTALHACNTATDDAIRFALEKKARYIVVVPCCQAEVASVLRKNKAKALADPLAEIWRHPLHTREFGSQITNVLRCLQLEAHGYQVSVTELVGWEHSMKNELIIAQYKDLPRKSRRNGCGRCWKNWVAGVEGAVSWLRGEAGGCDWMGKDRLRSFCLGRWIARGSGRGHCVLDLTPITRFRCPPEPILAPQSSRIAQVDSWKRQTTWPLQWRHLFLLRQYWSD